MANEGKQKGKDSNVKASIDSEETENKLPKIKVTIVNDFELINQLVKKLEITKEIVALDTETNSLKSTIYLCIYRKIPQKYHSQYFFLLRTLILDKNLYYAKLTALILRFHLC